MGSKMVAHIYFSLLRGDSVSTIFYYAYISWILSK